jgi:hypothetical protein
MKVLRRTIMKKLLLLLIGLAFALAFSSCDDQDSNKKKCQAANQKQLGEKEKHHKRW